jgi:hypothetical protein
MRRSICYCEPSQAQAGEQNTWKFIYTSAASLPKGARLKFDIASKGRDIDWEVPSVNPKSSSNVIYALLENGKTLQPKEIDTPDNFTPQYEFILPAELAAGSEFTIIMGAPKDKKSSKPEQGNRAQSLAQRRKPFLLYIDPVGKGNYEDPESFNIDIRGNSLHAIKVLTPSFVAKNKRFDVVLRFEDEYGNLTNDADEETLIELSYENLRENLNWKLFIPETGFIALPNLYFNEEGVYTIQLLNTTTKEVFRSSPIKCFPDNNKNLFWGLIHGESERYDSTENIDNCLRHMRDEKALNFFGVSPFESAEETSNDTWKHLITNITEFDEDERFTSFMGFQWMGSTPDEGLRQFLYLKDGKQILRKKEAKNNTLKKIYKSFNPKELLSIPSLTMAQGYEYDFKDFSPEFERVVEIYNAWGSSECTAKEGNSRPIKGTVKTGGAPESAKGSIQKALQQNCRFGFVAGGLDDRGVYSDLFDSDQAQYSPGLTAVIAKAQTHEAIAEALYNRSCYATTGERIIIGFYIAGFPMGSEINTADKPGLAINRHISGYVAGTTALEKVEVICNGKVVKSLDIPRGYALQFAWDHMTPIEKLAITPGDKKPPFLYYYIRVTQEDGHMAWSSPIWIDILPRSAAKIVPKPAQKPVKKEELILDEEEEDDDFDEEEEDEGFDLEDDED